MGKSLLKLKHMLALGLFIILITQGSCWIYISSSSEPSNHETRKAFLDLYMVHSLKRFYPNGTPSKLGTAFPQFNHINLNDIEIEMNIIANRVHSVHSLLYKSFNEHAHLTMNEDAQYKVRVVNEGKPLAHSDHKGVITIDIRILEALFRGALLESYRKQKIEDRLFFKEVPVPKNLTPGVTSEQLTAINQYLELIHRVENVKTEDVSGLKGLLKRLISDSDIINEERWAKEGKKVLEETTNVGMDLVARYSAAISFLVAHEFSHLMLKHHERRWSLEDTHPPSSRKDGSIFCTSVANLERQADAYALFLIIPRFTASDTFTYNANWTSLDMKFGIKNLTGYTNYFNYGYHLSGFKTSAQETCSYPKNVDRRDQLDELSPLMRSIEAEDSTKLKAKLNALFH